MSEESRIAVLENTINHLDASLVDIRQDIKRLAERVEFKFDSLDKDIKIGFNGMNGNFKEINNRIWSNFTWIITAMLGLLGVMAHGFHWF